MSLSAIGCHRLVNQGVAPVRHAQPAEVVAAMGAMQAQDYTGALWSIGLRLPLATESTVEQAIAKRTIVRTWPMRGTLHFVAAKDVRWMLALLTPRIIVRSTSRASELELDSAVFARCRKLFTRALAGKQLQTRDALMALLEENGIRTANQRGYHILWRLAQEGLICFGTRVGKQHTFALMDEWVPPSKAVEREAALIELARRYFASHGPATMADFAGWAGLKKSDAQMGMDGISSKLVHAVIAGATYYSLHAIEPRKAADEVRLLPGFDEFILGYKERGAVIESRHAQKVIPGNNGQFTPTIIIDGIVAGTWKRSLSKKSVTLLLHPFARLKHSQKEAVEKAAEDYGRFLGLPMNFELIR